MSYTTTFSVLANGYYQDGFADGKLSSRDSYATTAPGAEPGDQTHEHNTRPTWTTSGNLTVNNGSVTIPGGSSSDHMETTDSSGVVGRWDARVTFSNDPGNNRWTAVQLRTDGANYGIAVNHTNGLKLIKNGAGFNDFSTGDITSGTYDIGMKRTISGDLYGYLNGTEYGPVSDDDIGTLQAIRVLNKTDVDGDLEFHRKIDVSV